ncbi:hypothetical protein FRC03_007670 [Tulasnella sp. 419]|nr:hypothetical protein FRC03_007670 [Tulasnella sp. 419]
MAIEEIFEANWDHVPASPTKPPQPPTKFALAVRKVMLTLRPEFKYGDERDKIQRQNSRRAQRQLARDEAWAQKAEKKAQLLAARQKRKAQQTGNSGFGLRKAAGFMRLGDSSKAKAKPAASASRRRAPTSSQSKPVRPAAARHGSSNVKIYTLGVPTAQPTARRTSPVPNARVVYTRPVMTTSKSAPHTASARPKPTTRPTVRAAPHSYQGRPAPARQPTNAARYTVKPAQPWAALQARVVTMKK